MKLKMKAAAAIALVLLGVGVPAANAAEQFGLTDFGTLIVNKDGSTASRAGAHPYSATTSFRLQTEAGPPPIGGLVSAGQGVKDIEVDLPAGFIGDPSAVPVKCAEYQLNPGPNALPVCPAAAQVGTAMLELKGDSTFKTPIYAMQAPEDIPALFGFWVIGGVTIHLVPEVRTGGDYGLTMKVSNVSQVVALTGSSITFWGVPADASHDPERGQICQGTLADPEEICFTGGETTGAPRAAFLTNPVNCAAGSLPTTMRATPWAVPPVTSVRTVTSDGNGVPTAVDGCEKVPFEAALTARPTTSSADSPTGLEVKLTMPQPNNPDGLATAHLKRAEIVLPEGMAVNPSSAAGLDGCSPAQIDLSGPGSPSCPESSRIGSVAIHAPLLDDPLEGSVYLAEQGTNPFDSLLAIYLTASGRGVTVKLAGKVAPDPVSGRLSVTFDDNPQLPFDSLEVSLKSGERAPLVTPSACGAYTTTATFSPWSAVDPDNATAAEKVISRSSFAITSGPDGRPCPAAAQFDPSFNAGTLSAVAGTYAPLVVSASRPDGSAPLNALDVTLAPGLIGRLAEIPYCSDRALTAASSRSGRAEQTSSSCPLSSGIGTVTVDAGAGGSPYQVTGRVYLAGPYRGAPLSLAVVTPAVAGPFDLGTVVVRSALRIDPVTAQVTVQSDRIPQVLEGIPLKVRSVAIEAGRPRFTLNPTDCSPRQIGGTLFATSAAKALSTPFQVTNCAALAFKPHLKLKVKGATKRGKYPKLRAELKAPEGQANIGKVSVALPHSEFLAQEHIKTICTRVQYSANGGGGKACPKGSVYGWARAFTPLLDQPLEGPVFLRSSSNPLPDLVASLDGQIHIDLAGRIDSVNGGIRNTFEAVPDAPVSKFVLSMKGGKKSLLVNSRNLCAGKNRATVKMDGQNGKTHDFRPLVGNSCKGKAKLK